MKCKYCNAPITVEDEYCPYCGAVNEGAKKHISDMKKYIRDYAATKAEVMANVEKQREKHGLIIAACILAILNIVVIIGLKSSWAVKDALHGIKVRSHAGEYTALLTEYEAEGNYFELDRLYNDQDLYFASDSLRVYHRAADAARSFCEFLDNLYFLRSGNYSYRSTGDILSHMSRDILNIYDIASFIGDEWLKQYYEGSHGQVIADMCSLMEQVLTTRCGLTGEDISALPDMDYNEISLLLGRRMGYYE